ncbi:carbon-nitrogen hydrolase family protein [Brevibacillus choshinensis]|uniref:Carbon-nitrogen hydrolase family protein n=1 Tax=Brevibacillus choshinensis TaxID=54911 RepID=A0ABX7FLS0_BRECH|nr:carbon-nitrogen hydrolase family protein [Brevibacillus choshinensis]QRG66584.1 carbon-nitrogen hydrolase family protein [Brevibacillus choshinensis]
MRIGLAQTRFPQSLKDGIAIVKEMIGQAREKSCDVVCFPESILPGLRGVGYPVEAYDHAVMAAALEDVCVFAKQRQVAVILPIEWKDELGMHLVAFVISETGEILGYQTKNQIDPDEDQFDYVPGTGRHIFVVKDVSFGIVICHEGWRYPETVRWAARNGASIVFHPQFTNAVANPDFYQGAMVGRSLENNIYFASVNYALDDQGSATTLVSPSGDRLSVLPEGIEGLLVWDLDPAQAHGLLARRFHPELF